MAKSVKKKTIISLYQVLRQSLAFGLSVLLIPAMSQVNLYAQPVATYIALNAEQLDQLVDCVGSAVLADPRSSASRV